MNTSVLAPIRMHNAEEGSVQVSWRAALLPLAIIGVCLFSGLAALGLTGPDEPRYAAIARSMARMGDWVTPRLAGQPWLEKPILYYWTAASAIRCFGDGEFAARLPSAWAALLATLAIAWAALRAYGVDAARLALLMLPTTVAFIGFSRAAAPDMLFSALLAAAAVSAAEMLQKPRAGNLARLVFGALLGAAALAKGPAAVALAGGATLLWALTSRQVPAVLRFLHPTCLAAFAVTAVPWYLLCALRNPEFFQVFFLQHNWERYFTPAFEHQQPFWFFGPVLLAAIFPWTALVLPLGLDAFRSRSSGRWRNSPSLFFGCWAMAPVLFFSLSQSKLPGYILPSVPLLILLLAATLARRLGRGGSREWLALVGLTFPLLSLSAGQWLRRLPAESGLAQPSAWLGLLVFAAVGGLACAFLAWTRREWAAVTAVAGLVTLLVALIIAGPLPKIDPYLSARAAAQITAQQPEAAALVAVWGVNRSLQFGLEFYLNRTVPEWTPGPSRPVWIWTTASRAARWDQQGLRYTVLHKISQEAWLVRQEDSVRP